MLQQERSMGSRRLAINPIASDGPESTQVRSL